MTLRLAYYGDDFSGSSDVMEVLAQAGVPTRLFLEAPTAGQVEGLGAVGVAGVSRSLPTAGMEAVLRPVFESLKGLGAPLVHYKVCSTFDSSPTVGSIGKAIDVGAEVFGGPWIPLVVGAPALGRYVAFGNLFARSGQDSEVFRLDRHPTMNRHPVTPMREADLRLVLAEQTTRPVELIDSASLDAWRAASARLLLLRSQASATTPVLLFDTVGDHHLTQIGGIVWRATEAGPLFAVGSSGLEYALAAYWREAGELPPPPEFRAGQTPRVLVVSGSCSPVTARQIDWAITQGYAQIPVRPGEWIHSDDPGTEFRVFDEARNAFRGRPGVIIHAAKGPDDPRVEEANDRLTRLGCAGRSGELLGAFLGKVAQFALDGLEVMRVCVAGGDTSGFVARALGVRSLEFVAPVAPGSPLCRMHAPGFAADGREICFKGGQVGKEDFIALVRDGKKQI